MARRLDKLSIRLCGNGSRNRYKTFSISGGFGRRQDDRPWHLDVQTTIVLRNVVHNQRLWPSALSSYACMSDVGAYV